MSIICNPWNSSVSGECGTFVEPTVADEGQCSPYRVKITCEAPTLPVAQCSDTAYTTVYNPEDVLHPFYVVASLFDESCIAITDESAAVITLVLT